MFYIVGLGNPGPKYTNTRHNIGWLVLDTFCAANPFTDPESDRRHQALLRRGVVADRQVCCVYPQTYMNKSGETVRSLMREDDESTLVVVHDDIALPLGEVRVSYGRGHGGHNGIRSIFQQYKSQEFCRVRIGIAPSGTGLLGGEKQIGAVDAYVLQRFSWLERSSVTKVRTAAATILATIITEGCAAAMNKHN